MEGYDEDLLENPFYKSYLSKAKSQYASAATNRRTICVPRKGTTSRIHYNAACFETHTLSKVSDNESIYTTGNGKVVDINGTFIVTKKGFQDVKSVKILFQETFFNPNKESYQVLCIDQPLDGGVFTASTEPAIQTLETLQNCVEFLWAGSGARRTRQKIDEILQMFAPTFDRLESESMRHAVDAADAVFTRALQLILHQTHMRRPAAASKQFMDNIKLAVESYIMHGLYKRVFKGLSSFMASQDASLNKTTRNLADLQVKDLGINPGLWKNIPKAKKILSNLNKFTTPLEKLCVIKLTVACILDSGTLTQNKSASPVTADDLLPTLVFIIIKSEIPNWSANLAYMHNFHFSKSRNDEFQFYLSSVEAAVEYIQSGRLNAMSGLSHTQRAEIVNNLFQRSDSTEKRQLPSKIDYLFEQIRLGKSETVLGILNDTLAEDTTVAKESLCHPLCSCDKCEQLVARRRADPTGVTVFSRDDLGSTALHIAAEYGCDGVILTLVQKRSIVNAVNYHGCTPLHMACLRGHHNCVGMLIQYGASLNLTDNDGNTPLHLAVANGHEKCVEEILNSSKAQLASLEINKCNDSGDTVLHTAARWGFSGIVTLLLESGASIEARNKKKETPFNCALNNKVVMLLHDAMNHNEKDRDYSFLPPKQEFLPNSSISNLPNGNVGSHKSPSPLSAKKLHKVNFLLEIVAKDDVDGVRKTLGLPSSSISDEEEEDSSDSKQEQCHPLCQCSKCSKNQSKSHFGGRLDIHANMANKDGVCPLHIASLHGLDRMVTFLLKSANAEPNTRTKSNLRTPLHLACQYNHVACVATLIKNGAKVNLKDSLGNTALHFTCTNGHIGPAILLLQNNANPNVTNQRGNTPSHDAARWNFEDLVNLLLYYKASVQIRNNLHLTPLQYAQHDEVIGLLAEAESLDIESSEHEDKMHKSIKFSKNEQLFNDPNQLPTDEVFVSVNISDAHSPSNSVMNKESILGTKDIEPANSKRGRLERKTTVDCIFEALAEQDIETLEEITRNIRKFDRKTSLQHVVTVDKSIPFSDPHTQTMRSIQRFDRRSLRHKHRSSVEESHRESNEDLLDDALG